MMGILRRLFGGSDTDTDTAKATTSPATMRDPSDSAVDEPVTSRLSRPGKPCVRDNRFGRGKVEVTGE